MVPLGLDAWPAGGVQSGGGLIHQSHFCVVTFDACSEWGGSRGTELIFVGSYRGQNAHWGIIGREPGFKVMTCPNGGTSTGLDPQPAVFPLDPVAIHHFRTSFCPGACRDHPPASPSVSFSLPGSARILFSEGTNCSRHKIIPEKIYFPG